MKLQPTPINPPPSLDPEQQRIRDAKQAYFAGQRLGVAFMSGTVTGLEVQRIRQRREAQGTTAHWVSGYRDALDYWALDQKWNRVAATYFRVKGWPVDEPAAPAS